MADGFTAWGRRNRQERQIALLTARIPDSETLDRMLGDARPELRRAVFERLRPYLKFPVEEKELLSLGAPEEREADQPSELGEHSSAGQGIS